MKNGGKALRIPNLSIIIAIVNEWLGFRCDRFIQENQPEVPLASNVTGLTRRIACRVL